MTGEPHHQPGEWPVSLYADLRRMARRSLGRQRARQTLGTTALAHEAFLKLAGQPHFTTGERSARLGLAACAIRSVLVDHARRQNAQRRAPGGHRIPLDEAVGQYQERSIDLLALDEALSRLAGFDSALARLVELRFFGGLTVEETASALEVSARTVRRDWQFARAWLRKAIEGGVEP